MSAEASTISARRGTDFAFSVTALDGGGAAVAFDPADTPECTVWQGSDSAALFHPPVAWVSAPLGTIAGAGTGAQTAALSPGIYPAEITVTPAGTSRQLPVAEFWFELTEGPGTSAAPPVYGTLDDLFEYGGGAWLDTLRRREGLSNFARERAKARLYLDELVARKYRPWAGSASANVGDTFGPPDGRNLVVWDYLTADYRTGPTLPAGFTLAPGKTVLIVTERVREIVSLKALELVCRQRITLADDGVFPRLAARFRAECRNRVLSAVAELDVNQDGYADYAFPLGLVSLR